MPYQIENRMVVDTQWKSPYKVVARCSECESEIYEGEYFFDFNGDCVCESCKDSYIKENFRRVIE